MLINLIVTAIAVFVTASIIPGVTIGGFGASIVVAIILGLVNLIVKPILTILTLPINLLTFGLFSLVINAIIILIVDALTPGFSVDGFLTAFIFSLVLAVIGAVLYSLVG